VLEAVLASWWEPRALPVAEQPQPGRLGERLQGTREFVGLVGVEGDSQLALSLELVAARPHAVPNAERQNGPPFRTARCECRGHRSAQERDIRLLATS